MNKKQSNADDARFEKVLKSLRANRSGERSSTGRIIDTLSLTVDYDYDKATNMLLRFRNVLGVEEYRNRFANYLSLRAELFTMAHVNINMFTGQTILQDFVGDGIYLHDIYDYPSFAGTPTKNEEDGSEKVSMPDKLKNFKGSNVVLKIMDMQRFIDTFTSRNSYYKRAYAILADLDREMLECVGKGEFPAWANVEYKDGGDALFEFSHFEVDMREPDENYRTLYIVYRYDTTIS